jgi:hypothetical protein
MEAAILRYIAVRDAGVTLSMDEISLIMGRDDWTVEDVIGGQWMDDRAKRLDSHSNDEVK